MSIKPLQPSSQTSWKKPVEPSAAHAPVDMRWRWHWLQAAPHRLGFFHAAVLMCLAALWWAGMLLAHALELPVAWALPPALAHALWMTQGFMPLFIVGFLFTAGPRWLNVPEPAARALVLPVRCYALAWVPTVIGFHASAWLAATGLGAMALAWGWLVLLYARLWRQSPATDKAHPSAILAAVVCGALCMLATALGTALGMVDLVRAAIYASLWGFLGVVFAAVSHRMIPFFTASAVPFLDAWRPMWLLWSMLAVLGFEGLGAVLDVWLWPVPPAWRWVQVAVEAPAAALMLWLTIRWGLVQSLKIRLLAMLHGGFMWLGLALALQAASHALMALTHHELSLGLAPLHALTMGYLGATLFAMATRVSAGHSGRPLAADDGAWALYWMVQAAVVLRLVSALAPAVGAAALLAAIALWALACLGWSLRYGSWYGRPRADGRAG
ncbi:MAG: NnrS family protein [Rhodoferax sp.]